MNLLEISNHIARLIKERGGRTFFVGGCVRDFLLGDAAKDIDLEVYGLDADALERLISPHYPLNRVGASFGVFKLAHCDIDIALPRTENKTGRGHRGFMVSPLPDLDYRTAASRRDFTVNAIMRDVLTEEIVDPWGGVADLKRRVLRHVSEHFAEDPLRVLRGMQFAGRLQLVPAPETLAVCRTLSQEELPPERLAGEWEKLFLKAVKPSLGLEFLRDCGWISYYPELENLIGCPQSPKWHPEGDVWRHTLRALDAFAGMRSGEAADDLALGLAVLCHDFGKPAVTVTDESGRISSCGHEVAGIDLTKRFISRMWRRQDLLETVPPLVARHMDPVKFGLDGVSDRAYRRLSLEVKRMDLLALTAQCDLSGVGGESPDRQSGFAAIEVFRRRAEELQVKASPPRPIVLGRHLIDRGMKPGKDFSPLLRRCFEAQLDGVFADEPGGLAYLDAVLRE